MDEALLDNSVQSQGEWNNSTESKKDGGFSNYTRSF